MIYYTNIIIVDSKVLSNISSNKYKLNKFQHKFLFTIVYTISCCSKEQIGDSYIILVVSDEPKTRVQCKSPGLGNKNYKQTI